jgi:hypothetical protein
MGFVNTGKWMAKKMVDVAFLVYSGGVWDTI